MSRVPYRHAALLSDPSEVEAVVSSEYPPIPHTDLPDRTIPVRDSREPLIELPSNLAVQRAYLPEDWEGVTERICLRDGVASRLVAAQDDLPEHYSLVILDGWRTATLQQALFDYYYAATSLEPGYVSDPQNQEWIAPHTTGGAVDLTLAWKGRALRIGTDFDDFTPLAWARALEAHQNSRERDLRRLLTSVLVNQGFVLYPKEWWHFSYGDQIWAFNSGAAAAIYGRVDEGC